MKKHELIIEKADTGYLGRVLYEDNLIVDEADTIEELEAKIKVVLVKFHSLNAKDIRFKRSFDLSELFRVFDVLKISAVAVHAGINPSLLRQYVIGNKFPSSNQTRKIEETIQRIGNELKDIYIISERES